MEVNDSMIIKAIFVRGHVDVIIMQYSPLQVKVIAQQATPDVLCEKTMHAGTIPQSW